MRCDRGTAGRAMGKKSKQQWSCQHCVAKGTLERRTYWNLEGELLL
jgi:hypothetical protein